MKNVIFLALLFITGCTTIQDSNIRTVYQNPQFVSAPVVYTPPVTSVIASPVYWNNWGWGGWGGGGWGWGRGWGGCW